MILALSGFWLVVVSLIVFVLIIGIIIIVHELGHFLVARKAAILCHEFSIGMGPCIYKKQFKSTLFCLRAIPIGGYVQMADDEVSQMMSVGDEVGLVLDEDEVIRINADTNMFADVKGKVVEYSSSQESGMYITIELDDSSVVTYIVREYSSFYLSKNTSLKIAPYKETFSAQSLWKRFLVLLAGPVMNFILAILIYFIYFCAVGVPNYNSNVIGTVGSGYFASEYLEVGDEIISVAGISVSSWTEFQEVLTAYNEDYPETVTLGLIRDGKEIEVEVKYSIIINSIGLSNLNASDELPEGVAEGIVVGTVALNYLDEDDTGDYPLDAGDVIVGIRVDNYITSKTVEIGEEIEISSWAELLTILGETDAAQIRFKYYDLEKGDYIDYDECAAIVTWSNETLTSQSIEKIEYLIGISPTYYFNLGGVITSTFTEFWSDFTLVFRTLKVLIAPSGIRQIGVDNLSSVVGIYDMVIDLVQTGILPILAFAALLSVNIGIMNLLPIPALDGGRIVFLGYELVTKRRPNKKFENALNTICFILLIILFIIVTYNDILRF